MGIHFVRLFFKLCRFNPVSESPDKEIHTLQTRNGDDAVEKEVSTLKNSPRLTMVCDIIVGSIIGQLVYRVQITCI